MKKLLTLSIAATLAGALAGSVHAELAKSGMIERYFLRTNTNASASEVRRTYWQGENMRVEHYTLGGLIVEIKNGRVAYQYNPAKRIAARITAGKSETVLTVQSIIKRDTTLPKGLKKVGKARVGGVNCDVYTPAKKESGVQSVKLYFGTDPRFPGMMKQEVAAGTLRLTDEVRKLQLNVRIPDAMFQIPKGVKIVENKAPSALPKPSKGRKGN